jgi:hypothetical protein
MNKKQRKIALQYADWLDGKVTVFPAERPIELMFFAADAAAYADAIRSLAYDGLDTKDV